MNCPRCDKRQLDQFSFSGLHLDQCKSCEGIWFDEGELRAILDAGEDSSISPELERSLVGEIRTNETPGGFHLKCPRCGFHLERYLYGYNSTVLVDGCPTGCGVWIDDGELAILFDYAVGLEAELDPETRLRIDSTLAALAAARKEREDRFVDSLVTLDDSDGPLKPVGVLLQAIYAGIYAAMKKFI